MTKTSWIYGAALWMINGLLLLPLNAREFKSANGKVIEAELVSATPDGKIVIRRGTKEFTVAASAFSVEDQTYIREWMTQNADKVRYSFGYYADAKPTNKNQTVDGSMISDRLKTRPHVLTASVSNNNPTDFTNLKVVVDAIVEDFVDARTGRYSRLAVGVDKKDLVKIERVRATVDVESLLAHHRLDVDFDFHIESYVDRDGRRIDQAAADRVLGAWIRIYQQDKVIGEYTRSFHNSMDNIKWSDENPTPAMNVEAKKRNLKQ